MAAARPPSRAPLPLPRPYQRTRTRIRSPDSDELLGLDGERALPRAEPISHHLDESVVAVGLRSGRPCRSTPSSCPESKRSCGSSRRAPTPRRGSSSFSSGSGTLDGVAAPDQNGADHPGGEEAVIDHARASTERRAASSPGWWTLPWKSAITPSSGLRGSVGTQRDLAELLRDPGERGREAEAESSSGIGAVIRSTVLEESAITTNSRPWRRRSSRACGRRHRP